MPLMRNLIIFLALTVLIHSGILYSCKKVLVPSLTTSEVSNITRTSALGGGNITSEGSDAITGRGICWSSNPDPTVALSTKTNNGSGIGKFSSNLTDLEPGHSYYVRAFAVNSSGTTYGENIHFNTITYGEINDPAGDVYPPDSGPDLTYASIVNYGDSILLHVEFEQSTFDRLTACAGFMLDTDCDPSTGFPGVDASGSDSKIIACEYEIIARHATDGLEALIIHWLAPNRGEYINSPTTSKYLNNGFEMMVHIKTSPNNYGKLNFKVCSFTQLSDTSSTGIFDYMTDLGQLVGIVR
jgi:hypothetical protein